MHVGTTILEDMHCILTPYLTDVHSPVRLQVRGRDFLSGAYELHRRKPYAIQYIPSSIDTRQLVVSLV